VPNRLSQASLENGDSSEPVLILVKLQATCQKIERWRDSNFAIPDRTLR
jgi:hypothetical protein